MIKKHIPWSKKDGNSAGALVGREHLGCEIVHEGEGDIRAEYVFNTLGKYAKGVNTHIKPQYNPRSRATRSS